MKKFLPLVEQGGSKWFLAAHRQAAASSSLAAHANGVRNGAWSSVALPALVFAVLAGGVSVAWAKCETPAPRFQNGSHNEGVGTPFPGPPAHQDLRESVNTQKNCIFVVQPYRMSRQELQELRRAIRAQAGLRMGEERRSPPRRSNGE